jgi:transposase
MFWGSISGLRKEPNIFWEKQWGRIGSANYYEHIILVIKEYIRGTRLLFMQDNTLKHATKDTLALMAQKGIYPISWPTNSPDLNVIEGM